MAFPQVTNFSGLITPLELITSFKDCEFFYDKENEKRKDRDSDRSKNTKVRSDIPKIKAAGFALLEPTVGKWWRVERSDFIEEGATWNGFIDAHKDKALDPLWRAYALKTIYTLQQNDASRDDYLAAMADACNVLWRRKRL